jgi:hypothetical protein
MGLNKWIICLLLCIGSLCYGQNSAKKIPLTDVIVSIEKQFNLKFSYAVEDVASITIERPKTSLNLKETIEYLNSNTLLNFKAIDNRYVTVSVINKTISLCGILFTE